MPTVPTAPQTDAEKQIERALHLERERADLQSRISKNREYLRLMDANDALTDEQGDWLDKFYPLKEKGERRSDDDIKATREAKKAAREHTDKATEAANVA
jgi:hypothetical protein